MTELYSSTPSAPTRRTTLRAAGGGTLLLGLGLAGCRSAVSEAEAPAGKAGAGPRRGGTLTVAVNTDFTPSLLFAQSGQSLQQRLIYNTLTRYDDRLRPQPELATSWEYVEGGRSVTLKLRTGVIYHDGRPFTADDVIFAVKNLQNPLRAAQLRATAAAVTGFEKRGDHELVLKLAHPVNNLFDLFEFMVIADRHSVEDAVSGKRLNGTGPFELTKWSPGAGLSLTRNEKYWQPGRPYLDGVEIRVVPQADALLSSLRSGQSQLSFSVPGKNLAVVKSTPGLAVSEYSTGGGAYYLGVNTTVAPLHDKTVRQALAWGIDRERILKQVLGGYGLASATPWPKSSPAFTEAGRTHYTYDPGKARELLRSAGHTRLDLPLLHVNLPGETAVAEAVQYDLKQIGVQVTLQPTDPATAQKHLIAQTMPGLWTMGHGFAQVQPSTLAVSAYPFNEAKNTSRFRSAAYTKVVRDAWTGPATGAAANALRQRITDTLLDEAFIIDLVIRGSVQVSAAKLRGVTLNKFSYLNLDDAHLVD
ncbi:MULTISPECIES: ABC transporter substrate-binding protein [Streptomyces]|uniref:Peptide ABC transporter substrate-binding protein n=1 Tax=Streptomyces viridochromogenes TaxID=1938 RepID=A0A0L8JPG2_STRVR|nr:MULTISPECIES: ABC transporter substrate-binding protein [Streptomyces]KOG15568.1 peptide ABC transporter substrate-binding protein [Streptomyces viridochromogenes]